MDVLNGKPQRLLFPLGLFPEQTEGFQHGRAAVPGHVGTLLHDIVSQLGADRDKPLRRDLELRQEFPVFLLDSSIDVLPVADQIHLVDHHGDLSDTEQREEIAVFFGLLLHAFLRVDQQQGRLRPRGA